MKKTRSLIVALALASVVIVSCKQSEEKVTASELASAAEEQQTTSTAAVEKKNDTRKFIRTADLKFKAKDVAKTTYAIESITSKYGGFVAYTNLQSNTNHEETNKLNSDSSVVVRHFTVENQMVLRVPNTKLDSTLRAITPLIGHLDSRLIKADDVSLKLLSNRMAQNRVAENTKRLENAIDGKGKKLNDIANAENLVDEKKAASDLSKLGNLSLKDQINFSTVNIAMYQNESVSHEMIVNPDNGKYIQGFGSRMLDSLQTGMSILTTLLVFFTNLWPIFAIAILGYFTYKKYKLSPKK